MVAVPSIVRLSTYMQQVPRTFTLSNGDLSQDKILGVWWLSQAESMVMFYDNVMEGVSWIRSHCAPAAQTYRLPLPLLLP
jgi:hypothetical protein